MNSPLNARHERFCEFVAAGDSQAEAYLKAGYRATRLNARKYAARLMTKGDIKSLIAQLRAKQTAEVCLTRDRKRAALYEIVMNEENPLAERLRAIAEDNKMAGHYEPEKVELESGPRTLAAIEERARHVAAVLSIARVNSPAPSTRSQRTAPDRTPSSPP